jgi:hypothetical protein
MVVPVIILAYLSLIAATWLATHVFCISRGGPSNGKLGLWLVRRLGWAVCLQPAILGLVSLSRRQWIAGGLGLGFALLGLIISETLTFSYGREDPGSEYLERPEVPDDADAEEQDRRATTSTNSRLLTAYMPLPTRLPSSNPLPLVTDAIDDLVATERAANATPGTAALDVFGADTAPDLWDESRGVIYPPELIASEPLVWLPRDTKGFAKRAVASLGEDGLQGFVDPGPMSGTGTGTGASADVSKSEKHKSTSTTTATA